MIPVLRDIGQITMPSQHLRPESRRLRAAARSDRKLGSVCAQCLEAVFQSYEIPVTQGSGFGNTFNADFRREAPAAHGSKAKGLAADSPETLQKL